MKVRPSCWSAHELGIGDVDVCLMFLNEEKMWLESAQELGRGGDNFLPRVYLRERVSSIFSALLSTLPHGVDVEMHRLAALVAWHLAAASEGGDLEGWVACIMTTSRPMREKGTLQVAPGSSEWSNLVERSK
eukprot:scaffold153505_cov52-Cyclotella_meneghiniana.AAC.1